MITGGNARQSRRYSGYKTFTISPWLTAEFTVGEGELMTHDEPFFMAPDDKHGACKSNCVTAHE